MSQGIASGRLRGTTNFADAIRDTDLSMICVGTPSKKNGDLELNYIEAVCREIGFVLRDKTTRHTIVVRSTVLPGTVANVVIPILEDCSGKKPASTSVSRSTRSSCANPPPSPTTTCHR